MKNDSVNGFDDAVKDSTISLKMRSGVAETLLFLEQTTLNFYSIHYKIKDKTSGLDKVNYLAAIITIKCSNNIKIFSHVLEKMISLVLKHNQCSTTPFSKNKWLVYNMFEHFGNRSQKNRDGSRNKFKDIIEACRILHKYQRLQFLTSQTTDMVQEKL